MPTLDQKLGRALKGRHLDLSKKLEAHLATAGNATN